MIAPRASKCGAVRNCTGVVEIVVVKRADMFRIRRSESFGSCEEVENHNTVKSLRCTGDRLHRYGEVRVCDMSVQTMHLCNSKSVLLEHTKNVGCEKASHGIDSYATPTAHYCLCLCNEPAANCTHVEHTLTWSEISES